MQAVTFFFNLLRIIFKDFLFGGDKHKTLYIYSACKTKIILKHDFYFLLCLTFLNFSLHLFFN